LEAASIISLVVIIDTFLKTSLENMSPISQKIISLLSFLGVPSSLGWFLGLFLLFVTLRVSFQIFTQYSILKTKYAVLRDIMLGTYNDFFNSSWYFFSSGKQGTFLNTLNNEIIVVGNAFGAMARFFSIILQTILYLFLPFYLSWKVTSLVLILALLFLLPFFLLGKINYRLGKLNTTKLNELNGMMQEALSSAKIVLGFGNQKESVDSLAQCYDSYCKTSINSQVLTNAIPLAYYPFGLLVLIIALFVSQKIALPISETIILFYSLSRFIPLIGSITEEKSRLDNFFPSYEQILQLRNRAKSLQQSNGFKEFQRFDKEIVMDKVSFAYPNNKLILDNVNVIIPKGKMVAIVGKSGEGKSTFVDMIMRFHDPISGSITIDGANLKDYQINSYRERIGYVSQDIVLFNVTVRDNLLWANKSASDKEIITACQQANAEEFILKLPKKYNTFVGDRGVRLSGGQAQRIALARAILRKPDILILDEATSNLDTHSEQLIQQSIEEISKDTTVIVVAHRLSTIKKADYIYVLKDGKIEEEGTHSELIQQNGLFYDMVNLQTLERTKK
jgi:ATP-binding cassette subfamily B protein